ncbi:voltage-dependent anion-selective channel-like isoform X1 [Pieris brassicae]|uniref:voltage-dependent anion-selective channel-like isoform X1 n=2 Tax=Pieris brassicae TaxID=7116 RepID=UPI001E6602D4|nr:voltage-dependent anion-selective channel-like isoform X1 [Pieris brassicae]
MSILEYLSTVCNKSFSGFLGVLHLPTISAAITKEKVPCLRSDGSMSQMDVCKDEWGQRVDCPVENNDDGDDVDDLTDYTFQCCSRMSPPHYADLGKKANDVFSKGYHFGVFKLDLKTKSESGVEFTSGITSNQESGKVFGSLSSKYAVKDYGLTFTEKWNTDNTLATDITIQDKIAQGLKVTLEGTFAPQTGSKTGKLKTSFANDTVAVNTNVDLDLAGPVVDVAAVLKYQGWLAGANTQFDTQKAKFSKNNFAFGYQTNDFALHTNVDNGKDFGGSIYQKVSDKLDCGVSMKWSSGSTDTLFGVGAKFALDQDASLHAKINNKSLIGLGYQQKLRPGVTLTLSAAVDGQNFNAGGHKVGVALELEP